MSISKDTAVTLAGLYGTREHLQRQRERAANRNAWMNFVDRGAAPTERTDPGGVRPATELEMIVDALGGRGDVASLFMQAVGARFESMQIDIDKQIADLGGEP